MPTYQNITGDCLQVLSQIDDESIDLVMTSPPYADARRSTYGGPPPDEYVDWFMPISKEIKRVIKPEGTFLVNIKEKVVNGERSTYVMELILAMRKDGWRWTEEWIWHKTNAVPGKWPNRLRDAFERVLQFNLQTKFKMNQEAVAVPIGDWAKTRLKRLSDNDKKRHNSQTQSGFGRNVSRWVGKKTVLPTNVFQSAAECGNKSHPAAYPKKLPTFFIKLFSDRNDLILDPFGGSGTTGVAAIELDRNYIGIDLDEKYSKIATDNIERALTEKQATPAELDIIWEKPLS